MQLLGLILLLSSSWYVWKLTSNFLDEPTKKELTNSLNNLKNKFSEGKQNFSKAKKDKVLTKAIKYHPVEELLVTSFIYFDLSEELII